MTILIQFFSSLVLFLIWLFADRSWLGITLLVSFVVSIISLLANARNFLFFIRTLFIVWIGLVPAVALYLGGYFAWRMPFVQSLDIAYVLSIITVFALFSSQLGFKFGQNLSVKKYGMDFLGCEKIMLYFMLLMVVIVGFFIMKSRGELIFFSGYSSVSQKSNAVSLPFQNLQSIAILLSLFCFVLYFRIKDLNIYTKGRCRYIWFLIISAIIFLAIWCQFLRGARMDPLTLVFGCGVLVAIYRNNHLRLNLKVSSLLFLTFILVQFWGGIRHDFNSFNSQSVAKITKQLYKGSEKDGVPIYFRQGTMNNLSLSVATVIYAIENNDINYRFGSTYFDYLPRTPPSFIYPDRPKSLSWLSDDLYGGGGAGGGFNEMAESYLNFGVFGSLIIPGLISFFLSYSFKQFLVNRYNVFRSLLFLSFLSVYFRGMLYQTFSLYKTLVTALILYGVLFFLFRLIRVLASFSSERDEKSLASK